MDKTSANATCSCLCTSAPCPLSDGQAGSRNFPSPRAARHRTIWGRRLGIDPPWDLCTAYSVQRTAYGVQPTGPPWGGLPNWKVKQIGTDWEGPSLVLAHPRLLHGGWNLPVRHREPPMLCTKSRVRVHNSPASGRSPPDHLPRITDLPCRGTTSPPAYPRRRLVINRLYPFFSVPDDVDRAGRGAIAARLAAPTMGQHD
ncbi:uncharacterized protein LY79DRAFT_31572 [Colletotrichum navitas]|uniref:Uncharacterized protein n=1 Tax=Colletotrichum navitas TaxID=681940 RepID=A0AAD8Q7W4_9PEZI|nr:uncharacterized protein LY79DRAFT_31572 [Colletotrichum navitas]KAK1596802.1 hypothetical protein LY79DRAFT_31572 [Colletotrichum navitas]